MIHRIAPVNYGGPTSTAQRAPIRPPPPWALHNEVPFYLFRATGCFSSEVMEGRRTPHRRKHGCSEPSRGTVTYYRCNSAQYWSTYRTKYSYRIRCISARDGPQYRYMPYTSTFSSPPVQHA